MKSATAISAFLATAIVATFAFAQAVGDNPLTATPPPNPTLETPPGGVQLSPDGIFNCRTGRYTMDVGCMNAGGCRQTSAGPFVPVADFTTELNTGYLVYKFCTLDPMIAKIRQGITAGIAAADINAVLYGEKGQPEFVGNRAQFLKEKQDEEALDALKSPAVNNMCGYLKNQAVRDVVRQYLQEANDPGATLSCTLLCSDTDREAFVNGTDPGAWERCGGLAGLSQLALNPANSPAWAPLALQTYTGGRIIGRIEQENTYLGWANGFKSPERVIGGVRQITTPGWLIAQSISQVLGSGYRQLENANSINQIVDALFSTLSSQILTNYQSGLLGLSQPENGRPSYLSRLVAQSATEVRNTTANAALTILINVRNIENQYLQAKLSIAEAVKDATSRVRAGEAQCWVTLIPAVRDYAEENGISPLKVATSTAFGNAVVNARLAPLATSTAQDMDASKAALSTIDRLIVDVSNTSSAAVQSLALARLDTLVAERALHTSFDLTNAQQQARDIQTALTTLVTDTLSAWSGEGSANAAWDGTVSPGVGWCNTNNKATLQAWATAWNK